MNSHHTLNGNGRKLKKISCRLQERKFSKDHHAHKQLYPDVFYEIFLDCNLYFLLLQVCGSSFGNKRE